MYFGIKFEFLPEAPLWCALMLFDKIEKICDKASCQFNSVFVGWADIIVP